MITNSRTRETQTHDHLPARRGQQPGGSPQSRAALASPRLAAPVAVRAPHSPEAYLRSLDEAELVRRATCAPGGVDSAALGVLYERHAPSVFAFALSRLHNAAQAEDITAQTFLQVLRALPRYHSRGVPIRSWFLTIAANLIRDAYRRARTQSGSLGDRDHAAGEPWDVASLPELHDRSAEAAIAPCEDGEALGRLLGSLPPAQRDVLRYRFVAELTVAETANCMGRSEGAIKMLQTRALKALRRTITSGGHGDDRTRS